MQSLSFGLALTSQIVHGQAVASLQVAVNVPWIGPPLRAGCGRREQHAQQERD